MWRMPWRGIELGTRKKAADSLGTVSIPTVLGGRHLGPAASRLFAAGRSRCVIHLQTLIAIALTVATGLVVAGMLARAGLLDSAARRKLIATETPDPYDDP
jgi:hypothetical protein